MSNINVRGNALLRAVFPKRKTVTRTADNSAHSITPDKIRNAHESTMNREMMKSIYCW